MVVFGGERSVEFVVGCHYGPDVCLLDGGLKCRKVDLVKRAFVDPDVENRLGSPSAPAEVNTDKLRYRVRFAYPVDPLADPKSGGANATVNPSRQYLLDTPVFDDISVTYYSKPKILMYRLVNE